MKTIKHRIYELKAEKKAIELDIDLNQADILMRISMEIDFLEKLTLTDLLSDINSIEFFVNNQRRIFNWSKDNPANVSVENNTIKVFAK